MPIDANDSRVQVITSAPAIEADADTLARTANPLNADNAPDSTPPGYPSRVLHDLRRLALNGAVLGVPYCAKCKAQLHVHKKAKYAAPAEVLCACGCRNIEQVETWLARIGAAVDALVVNVGDLYQGKPARR